MKIGYKTFGKSDISLGLDIIVTEIKENFGIICEQADVASASNYDILLFSIYWWEHKYDYVKFIYEAGIIPHKKKPILIIGGSEILNPKPLTNYFDYAVLGDGEEIITYLIQSIIDKKEPKHKSIWIDGEENTNKKINSYERLRANHYVENRTNKLARVEISRGCKKKCPFCMISFTKPYRELPGEVIKQLIITSPTNRIALFSPDRASHSDYEKIEEWVHKYGKTNMGTDVRLDSISAKTTASSLRFGIEAFGERTRMAIGKPYSNKKLLEYFDNIFNKIHKINGNKITTATVYMIMGLPGETEEDYEEFANTLMEIDKLCNYRFTMFLSMSSFSAYYFTPFQWAPVNPYKNWNKIWKDVRPYLKNITIAQRGAFLVPSQQYKHAIAVRGNEKSSKLIYNIAVNGIIKRYAKDRSVEGGRYIEMLLEKVGIDPKTIIGELKYEDKLPWDEIESFFPKQKLWKMYEIFKSKTEK